MTHDELRASIGAYVLDALPEGEREALARHLASCPECTAEVESLRPVADALAYAAPVAAAPPQLRQRVVDRIARERASASGVSLTPSREPVPTPRPASVTTSGTPFWAMAAAAVLILATAAYAVSLRSRIAGLESQLSSALARASAAEQASLVAQAEVRNVRQTAGILVAADVSRVELAAETVAPGAKGRAYWSPSQGIIFTASGLPAPPPGRVYQVWAVTGLSPLTAVSAGLLTTDASGDALLVNESLDAAAVAFAVTLEPAGGVPAPTGPRYLLGAL